MINPTFIDVSGVGNSGKSAAVDLLREIDGLFVPHFQFEFDFMRVRGGLIDFRHALLEDWSPVRSHAAFLAFLDVASRMGRDPHGWWDFRGWLESTSQRYDRHFRGEFTDRCQTFAHSFLVGSYRAEWPYDDLSSSRFRVLLRKLIRRAGGRGSILRDVHLLDGSTFDKRASKFLMELFQVITPNDCSGVVLNNGFEPFNPRPFLEMLPGAKQIIITRDPRDVFVSGQNNHNVDFSEKALLASDNDGLNKSFLAADDVTLFVQRHKLYHKNLRDLSDQRVLKLKFEDLVLDYDASVSNVLSFLDVATHKHTRPRTTFDPDRSRKNVGIWRSSNKKSELKYIETQLEEYLVRL